MNEFITFFIKLPGNTYGTVKLLISPSLKSRTVNEIMEALNESRR